MESTLVILTRNEIDGVKGLFDKIPFNVFDEVFVMDCDSKDGTVKFFEDRGIKVINQRTPGRGNAFIESFEKANGKYIIFFSPDGNENPEDIPKLIDGLKDGYDIVIASRYMRGAKSDVSDDPLLIRKFGNLFFTFLVNLTWSAKVTDAINGFRGVSKSSVEKLKLDAPSHEIEFQMTIRSAKLKYKIKEIPTIEKQRIGGERKAKTFKMGFRFMEFFLKELIKGRNF
jgi:glycosyltransferase involved in cell wall biosynthesis